MSPSTTVSTPAQDSGSAATRPKSPSTVQPRNSSPQPPPPNQLAASRPSSSGKRPQSSGSSAGKKPDSSSKKPNQPPSLPPAVLLTQRTERSINEIAGEAFPPFDHQGLIVGPFTEETSRDASFEQELGILLLDAILETHAWAASRPKYESQMTVQKLEQKIGDVIEVEKEQGMLSPTARPTLVPRPSSSSVLAMTQSLPAILFGMH
ncbi:hypothetical protein VKT23_007559 [Stygiomarasmius scandens]|uniref:Uncharacterized protein n=1 Tax=Marasmiellus scandens TaxID=2682957 RepID=A0ABR1JPI3_9AGAR